MKRFISLLLILSLIVNMASDVQAESSNVLTPGDSVPLDMVANDYWSYEALNAALDTGLIEGDSGEIKPFDKMTRAELITMVLRALGLDSSEIHDLTAYQSDISAFTDISDTAWFYDQMSMAYRLNLINGTSSSELSPEATVTREQAFTILSRLMSLNTTDVDTSILDSFTDSTNLSSWARPYVAAMVAHGYVSGFANMLSPTETITRQDFAQLMYNIFHNNYISDQDEADALYGESLTGSLVVTSGDISLTNINISGDVIIGDGVGNDNAILDHVIIAGRLIVRGGGANSIYLKNSSTNTVIVNKRSDGGVRVYSDDGSDVATMEIQDGKDDVILECSITNLILSHDNLNVVINNTVKNISLFGDNAHISGSGIVNTLSLEKGVSNVSLTTSNTAVTNHSGSTVNLIDKDGKSATLSFGSSVHSNVTSDSVNSNKSSSNSTSSKTIRTVTFHSNGGSDLSPMTITSGNKIGDLPVPIKDQGIFIGWFTDNDTFKNSITGEMPIYANVDLYAHYVDSTPMAEDDVQTTTSLMDMASDYVINIVSSTKSMTAAEVKTAISFESITDATNFEDFSVNGSNGSYTITALNGYDAGWSYKVELTNDSLSYKDEVSSIRTLNLSIAMGSPVLKLTLNNSIKYLSVDKISNITQNGKSVDSLFAPLYTMEESSSLDNLYGSFINSDTQSLAIGDILAIYEGTSPDERISTVDYSEQSISYVTITGIEGTTIRYGNTDSSEVIFMPDVLPIEEIADVDGNPDNDSITIDIATMTYSGDAFAEMGLDASTTIDPGDFISFLSKPFASNSEEVSAYGKITKVETVGNFYIIEYTTVDLDTVLSSMDMTSTSDLNYEQLSANIDLEDAQAQIKEQVLNSGFAEAASEYLVALSQADDATRAEVIKSLGIQDFSTTKTLSTGSSEPEVNVDTKISRNLKHYSGDGFRCEVTVTTEIELGDGMSLRVSGIFVEEFKVSLNLKSKSIWKWKRWIPRLVDYQITANIDLYSYTYLALNMFLSTNSNEGFSDELNIKDSIDDLKDMTSNDQANTEVQKFYELYKNMLSQEHDYIDLFNVNISTVTGGIDPFHIIGYGFKVDFVVSLDANVALGAEFGYEKATRYSFTLKLKDKSATTSQTNLVNEKYTLNVYAMGELGVRIGIRITVEVGLLDISINAVGVSAEVGAYWQVWGFVYYELVHENNKTTSTSGGGCYMEIGMYLSFTFIASVAQGKIASYSKTLYDNNWPLWKAGAQYNTYDFYYTLTDQTDDINLKGIGKTYTLPSSVFQMSVMDFKTGDTSKENSTSSKFTYTLKDDINKVFTISKTGVITVTPPSNTDIATASLVVTWNASPLSFTSVPISRTFELTWDNLSSSYVMSFDSNAGSNVSSIKGAYGSSLKLPTPIREGYSFSGWYTDNNTFLQAFTQKTMPATNNTLYAKWTASTTNYLSRHYQQNVSASDYVLKESYQLTGTSNSTVTPEVKNYSGFTSPASQTVVISGDGSTVVSYYYTRDSYTLSFEPNNTLGTIVSSQRYGAEILAPTLFKIGYTFTGWDTALAKTMPASNSTYSALWSLNTNTITYDLSGGSTTVTNPNSYTINSSTITLTNPTRINYIFTGWTGTGLSSQSTTVTIPSGSTGNRYYTATWTASSDTPYSVYHYREDSSGNFTILEAEVMAGMVGEATKAQVKTYNNYTPVAFEQENITADGKMIIKVYYTINASTITYDLSGGSIDGVNPVTYNTDSAPITLINPTMDNYVFAGWTGTDLSSPTTTVTIPSGSTGNRDYTATWTSNTNSVVFDKNATDATGSMDDLIIIYNSSQELTPNAYERVGYTFSGWNTLSDGSGEPFGDQNSSDDLSFENGTSLTLYAIWVTADNNVGVSLFDAKYSASYQVFDSSPSSSTRNGKAYDSSWGTSGASTGHQFSDIMLSGRYFTIRKTNDATYPIALYMYESDGTPVVVGTSNNLYGSSLIGLATNVNLTENCKVSLQELYGDNWVQGLASVGKIKALWNEGFSFESKNGFNSFFSGKTAYNSTGTSTESNRILNPSLTQLDAISDYAEGPLFILK